MRITKEGSGLLRWALVESAWRLVRSSPKWSAMYARLKERKGKKRAIVAVARKLLCVLYAMLRTRTPYKIVTTETKAPRNTPQAAGHGQDVDCGADPSHTDSDSDDDSPEPGHSDNRGADPNHGDNQTEDDTQELETRTTSRPQPRRQPNRDDTQGTSQGQTTEQTTTARQPSRGRPREAARAGGVQPNHGDDSPEDDAQEVGQAADRGANHDCVAGHQVRDQRDNGGQTKTEQNETPVRASHLSSEGRWT